MADPAFVCLPRVAAGLRAFKVPDLAFVCLPRVAAGLRAFRSKKEFPLIGRDRIEPNEPKVYIPRQMYPRKLLEQKVTSIATQCCGVA